MTLNLSNLEKMAFVKMIDSIIHADEVIHDAEIEIMSQLMERFDFDSEFVAKAKKENNEDSIAKLTSLSNEKKNMIIKMLNVVAASDGFVHHKEMDSIMDYCVKIGLCQKV